MKKVLSVFLIVLILLIAINNIVYADAVTDSMREWNKGSNSSAIQKMGGGILAVIQVVGSAVSLITLIILAIKYMSTSTNEKASIKQRLIPYLIGAIIVFGASNILGLIANMANSVLN